MGRTDPSELSGGPSGLLSQEDLWEDPGTGVGLFSGSHTCVRLCAGPQARTRVSEVYTQLCISSRVSGV